MQQFKKSKLLTISAPLLAIGMICSLPALADQGGDDPMPGIDIIIKEDPSLVPIPPASPSRGQLKKLSKLKGSDSAQYLSKIIAGHIKKHGGGGKVSVNDIVVPLKKAGCCVQEISKFPPIKFSFKPRDGKVRYSVYLKPMRGKRYK